MLQETEGGTESVGVFRMLFGDTVWKHVGGPTWFNGLLSGFTWPLFVSLGRVPMKKGQH